MRKVLREAASAARQVHATLIHGLLDHGRVRPGVVARRQRVEDVARREPRLALARPVERSLGDQAVDGLLDGEMALH
jgi:hypothetical protein